MRVAALLKARLGLALVATLLLTACGGSQRSATRGAEPQSYGEAAALVFAEGERRFERRDYEAARTAYLSVVSDFSHTSLAADAAFRIADSFFAEGRYEMAIAEYRKFAPGDSCRRLQETTSERIVDACYYIALSYWKKIPGSFFILPPVWEREMTDAERAYGFLSEFVRYSPNADQRETAREYRSEAAELLVSHELYVASFYARDGEPRASGLRAQRVLERFPDSPRVPNALFLLARARIELGDVRAAVETLEQLVERFPEHELSRSAQSWLSRYGG